MVSHRWIQVRLPVLRNSPPPKSQGTLRIMVDIAMSNGLRLSQKNLSYQDLRSLIEKLEVLC